MQRSYFRFVGIYAGQENRDKPVRLRDNPATDWRLKRDEVSILPYKNKGKNIKDQYRSTVLFGLTLSLLFMVLLFEAPLHKATTRAIQLAEQEVVTLEEIVQTKQMQQPPAPPRPPVPVEVPDDEVLAEADLDLDATLDIMDPVRDLPPPPRSAAPAAKSVEQEKASDEIFVVVEDMPEIIGGTASLYKNLKYPEMARKASVEGLVVVQVVIEPDGSPTNPEVVRSPSAALDEAAVEAVMMLRFKPGMQRGKPVRTKFALPVRFQLTA